MVDDTKALRIAVVDADADARARVCRDLARPERVIVPLDDSAALLNGTCPFQIAIIAVAASGTGVESIRALKSLAPRSIVLATSAAVADELALLSFRAGAADVTAGSEALEAAITRAVALLDRTGHTLLGRASETIFSENDPERLPEAIVSAGMAVMSSDTSTLFLPGIDGALYIAYSCGLAPEVQKSVRIPIGVGIAGKVASSREPIIINGNVGTGRADGPEPEKTRSSIIYPLGSGGRLVALLTFNRLDTRSRYTPDDLAVASVLASQIVLALENSRLARQNAVSERLAAVGQLAAGMAHEINTPIQFIGDSVHFIRESMDALTALVRKYASLGETLRRDEAYGALIADIDALNESLDIPFILESAPRSIQLAADGLDRVAAIVRSVKQFSHVGSTEAAPADVNQLVLEAIKLAANETTGVAQVEADLGDVPAVVCHAGEIQEVLLNLIVNASQAIGEKMGEPGVRGAITVRTAVEVGTVRISVADTGPGIPAAIATKVFDPFFSTKPVGKGTGMGLPTARTIVAERHGGTIEFATELGRGTTFYVDLPIRVQVPH